MRSGCDVEAGSAAGQVDHGAEAVHVPEAAGAGSDVLRSVEWITGGGNDYVWRDSHIC